MGNSDYPTFPCDYNKGSQHCGLTKREYFAGLAMQGLLASVDVHAGLPPNLSTIQYLTELSVTAADALLKQLE